MICMKSWRIWVNDHHSQTWHKKNQGNNSPNPAMKKSARAGTSRLVFFSMKPSSVAKQTSPTVTKIHYQSAYQLPLNPWLLHGWTLAKAFRRAGGAKLQMLMSLIGFLDTKNRRRPWDVQQNCWHWPMKVPFTKLEVILFQLKLSKELEGFHMEHWLCCGNLERNSMHRA
jgi:hypothetical protein